MLGPIPMFQAVRGARLAVVGLTVTALCAAGLWSQPPRETAAQALQPQVAAIRKGERLQVAVALPTEMPKLNGTLAVELLGPDGKRLAEAHTELQDTPALASRRLDLGPIAGSIDGARLRIAFGGRHAEVPLAKVLLIKGHEMSLAGGEAFHAGGPASFACSVHGVRSLTETVPLPGSEVVVSLTGAAGTTRQVYKGRTNIAGRAEIQFDVPDVEAGAYTLEVVTRSALGKQSVRRPIRINAESRIMLVSDRPMYQPGQVIHLRALVLRPFDLRPIAGKELVFEVEDPKANVVFKRTFKTSDYGVASVDFQLADEVNMGDYQLRAVLGETRAEKTVQVKRYVLPKFKTEVKADKRFYLPKETVKLELQSDYFFGKPVAGAKVEVVASTFDVAFHQFHTWKGETDANGRATLEIKLPAHFVGQPLQKGDALLKLDVKVVDGAAHAEAVTKTYPVSDRAVRVNLIAEGGKLAPNLENRVFVAASYPDGSPAANCTIELTHEKLQMPQPEVMQPVKRALLGTVKTNAAGLAEVRITPRAEQLRADNVWGNQEVELLGGKQILWRAQIVFDVEARARDAEGNVAVGRIALNTQPVGDNVLLRLDKAIYQTGARIGIDVRTSAGLPTVYVDIVRGGQIVLSKWLEVRNGRATYALDLPPTIFGSVEVHAYQTLLTGEVVRDSRVVYVQPRNDLKVTVDAGKPQFAPGEDTMIRFHVTDAAGKPTAAAIGVIIVDEAVYALQDLQPGLEKVYFTLQEELLRPRVQIAVGPNDTVEHLVREPALPADRQQIATVLLTAVPLPAPRRFVVAPAQEREIRLQRQIQQIGWALFDYAVQTKHDVIEFDKTKSRWVFHAGLLQTLVKSQRLRPEDTEGLDGAKLTLDEITRICPSFTAEALGRGITAQRIMQLPWRIAAITGANTKRYRPNKTWELPANLLDELVRTRGFTPAEVTDAWGKPLRLVLLKKQTANPTGLPQFDDHEIVSNGPDRRPDTADDITLRSVLARLTSGWSGGLWWSPTEVAPDVDPALLRRGTGMGLGGMQGIGGMVGFGGMQGNARGLTFWGDTGMLRGGFGGMQGIGGFGGGVGGMGGMMGMMGMAGGFGGGRGGDDMIVIRGSPPMGVAGGIGVMPPASAAPNANGTAKAPRVREFFPETMLWQPALITDDKGDANLALSFADSITTWRLSASANSRGGALGGATVPLKVFQDFFVDIDLPVSLTQGDEIAFPVAIYNYLKTPQTVKIELQDAPWFDLLDADGFVRSLTLGPNDVTNVRFRIRARRIGMQPLTVKAIGSARSDAVKRVIEVVPNGRRYEQVATDRLQGRASQIIDIPPKALPDASKLFVKIYPGPLAQVVDGLDAMLQMPCGCFEQTSSSAFPNVLIVDYIKRNHRASPQLLLKAEQLLNVGYQRLLTFERPGGGFDWWGSGEPLVWLSAYGLQEFSDMARVYPIDRGIIDRTQAFLMKKRAADGTWSDIGATHGETIAQMGNAKLLLTSYVTWSLLESGYDRGGLADSIAFIRAAVRDGEASAYPLALAALALASYDAKHDSTLEAIRKLDRLRQDVPDWKAICYPAKGISLTYAHGDSATIETTALAVLAMLKTGGFTGSINPALTYLVKMKNGSGAWGSTQATILALKALLGASATDKEQATTHFTIRVDGREVARGKVDAANVDVVQTFDLKGVGTPGAHRVEIDADGAANVLYQIVGRYYLPWPADAPAAPVFGLGITYDRTNLATNDLLRARATLTYHGKQPTYMVMLELGIAPGFTVDPGDFAEMVDKNRVKKFTITPRQVILYLGDVRPGDVLHFDYTLRARFPVRAQTPAAVAYEYNTPANRTEAAPVELTVQDRK